MKLPQVSTAFMLASSMVQRAMAEGPQATPATADDPEVIDGYAILYSLIGFFALTSCCCLCCEIINDRNDGNHVTAQVLGGPSTNQVQDPVPIEPPILTGVVVSADLGLASEGSQSFEAIGPLSPSPAALALRASQSPAVIQPSSAHV